MSVSAYVDETVDCLRRLSPERQREVMDFASYLLDLETRESERATQEVLDDPELMADLRASEEDLASGRIVRWEEMKDAFEG